MEFKKYQHVERFGNSEVLGIENGKCYIFPKIDGTNSSVWLSEGKICAGSRNRELSEDKDNAGFYKEIIKDENIRKYLEKHPTHRLFGEWLVPHSLKTYRDDAWRKFYIFDVCIDTDSGEGLKYLSYEEYKPLLDECDLNYLAPLRVIKNGTYDNFIQCLNQNDVLIQDGQGTGEGIVIKNYDFYNKYGRQTWAKIVTSEFKEKHSKIKGVSVIENKLIEEKIVDEFVTSAFIEKEYSKIVNDKQGWSSQYIPMLISKIFYELINEEMWNIIKKFKNPTINFKILNTMVINKIKIVKSEIF